jgi:hydrogenase maturation protease
MHNTAILCFGNPCRSDDGIGIYVADALKKHFHDRSDISIFDMGTGAFEVLFKLKGHQRIILVDAVINSGEPEGSLFQLPAEEVLQAPKEDPMVFLHSIKWDQALSYAKKILQDDYPDDIEVYLIAIADTRLEIQLSAPVQEAGDKLIHRLIQQLSPAPIAL